jgi:hypothetical protein
MYEGNPESATWNFRLVGEERNFLCMKCMRVIKSKIFSLILDDETKAVLHFFRPPTMDFPYLCPECFEKAK